MSDRQELFFPSGEDRCHAWLYLPEGATEATPAPVLVMGHGLGAIKEMRLAAFAERFQAEGYACLVFDYRYFGQSGGDPRELLSIPRQREDWRAAVAFARTLPEVDPDSVVAWGTSFVEDTPSSPPPTTPPSRRRSRSARSRTGSSTEEDPAESGCSPDPRSAPRPGRHGNRTRPRTGAGRRPPRRRRPDERRRRVRGYPRAARSLRPHRSRVQVPRPGSHRAGRASRETRTASQGPHQARTLLRL